MDILVVLEDLNGKIHRLSLEAIVGAQKLSASQNLNIVALAIGSNANELASAAAQYDIDKVLKVTNDLVSDYSSDGYTEVVRQVIERDSPKYIFFEADSKLSKSLSFSSILIIFIWLIGLFIIKPNVPDWSSSKT